MKVEFVNRLGGSMLVDESRVDEYLKAGYKLASKPSAPAKAMPDDIEEPAPKKISRKK